MTDTTQLSYCPEQSGGSVRCAIVDEKDAVVPAIEPSAMFVTTRLTYVTQTRVCDVNATSCGDIFSREDEVEDDVYFAGVEDFCLRLTHNVQAPIWGGNHPDNPSFVGDPETMEGEIIPIKGDPIKSEIGEQDIFPLRTLLEAADVDLDAIANDDDETFRWDGIVLVVKISYTNKDKFFAPAKRIKYSIEPTRIAGSSFKAEIPREVNEPGKRTYENRHGIRILFSQSGTIGHFSFQAALVNLVSALALIAVATSVVDLLMLKVLPMKEEYNKAKFEKTKDFSDVRDEMEEQERKTIANADEAKVDIEMNKLDETSQNDDDGGASASATTIEPRARPAVLPPVADAKHNIQPPLKS